MRPIIKLVLSVLALAFSLWAIWMGYKVLKGELPATGGLDLPFIMIIFLVLSCTYFLTDAIQKGAEAIAKKSYDIHKIQLYEDILRAWQAYFFIEGEIEKEKPAKELIKLEVGISLQANAGVLQAMKRLQALKKQAVSSDEIKDALIQLILAIRTDLGHSNLSIKKELQQLLK